MSRRASSNSSFYLDLSPTYFVFVLVTMSTAKHEVCVDCDPPRNDASHGSRGSAQPSSQSQSQAESSTSTSASATAAPSAPSADMQPPSKVYPAITIEFCDRCRWCVSYCSRSHTDQGLSAELRIYRAPRATWIQTELFLTFPTPTIQSITLIPLKAEETGGRFRVWLDLGDRVEMVWDRKVGYSFIHLIEGLTGNRNRYGLASC